MNRENIPYDVGIIGMGRMGSALANAIGRTGASMAIADRNIDKANSVAEKLDSVEILDVNTLVKKSKFIFIAVKPEDIEEILHNISAGLNVRKEPFVVVSIVAGATIEYITGLLGRPYPVIRVMPSSSCKVGSGTILYSCSEDVTMYDKNAFVEYMTFTGYLHQISESSMEPATAIAGCGQVIAYMMMEALADAGVLIGMTRKEAVQYSYEMLIGAARMVEATDKTPSMLKDDECTPGGVSVEVVRKLHEKGFSTAVIEGVFTAHSKITSTRETHNIL